jgi:hypothetical protein
MNKVRLELDDLSVESFETARAGEGEKGTVLAFISGVRCPPPSLGGGPDCATDIAYNTCNGSCDVYHLCNDTRIDICG